MPSKVTAQTYNIDNVGIMLGVWSINGFHSLIEIKLINVLLGICRYHIWKMRNNIKYGREDDISFIRCVKILKSNIENHLQVLLLSCNTDHEMKEKLKDCLSTVKIYL